MKTEIDAIMEARGIDFLFITGAGFHNPPIVYLTGGSHMTSAVLVKRRGESGTIFCADMERDEAARSGLPIRRLSDYPLLPLLKKTRGDRVKAMALRYRAILTGLGITSGTMAVCGQGDAGGAYAVYSKLQKLMSGLKIIGEIDDTVMIQARATKSPDEVERIRRIGKITADVVGEVAEFLKSQRVKDGVLVNKEDGAPVRIGNVKRMIDLWLIQRGVENPEGTIFSIGYDAAVCHSTGKPDDLLKLGKTIVFDIYPCEPGGGYFYDMTRTWCLGYAPDPVMKLYEDVFHVYQDLLKQFKPDISCDTYQRRACELFEAQGHPTIKTDPKTERGYVHSLGHGVGLNIHEKPFLGESGDKDFLRPGSIFTCEPGLYYPDREMGVRLEDTLVMTASGKAEVLAGYPLDLILPVG